MSPKLAWVLVFATMIGIASGQVLFKLGATHLERDGAPTPIPLLNVPIAVALVIYGVSTVLWVSALRVLPLRLAYPVSALAYIVVPLLAHHFLDEPLDWRALLGGAIIVAGIAVSTSAA